MYTKTLIGIIFVVVIIYIVILFCQRSLLNRIKATEQKSKKLDLDDIQKDFNKVKKLNLTGESLQQTKNLQSKFDDLQQQSLKNIDQQIKNVKSNAKNINFLKNIQKCQGINVKIDEANDQIENIKKSLHQLQDLSQQHQEAINELDREYKKIRKNLLAKNFIYGPSIKNLENYLSTLEKSYRQFSQLVKKGDHEEAEKLLVKLRDQTSELNNFIKEVPSLYKNLATLYPQQINEISSGYKQMVQDSYHFPEAGMDNAIQYVNKRIKVTMNELEELKINQVKNNNHQIENMIDQLYDSMETEIKAKRKVNKDVDIVTAYIAHAQKQNYSLMDELEQLDKNYDLNHNEIETTEKLRKELSKIDAVHQKDLEDMASYTAVYSIILNHQETAKKDLSQIESQQRQINSSVYDLNEEEANAKDNLQKFDLELHNIRRRIENLNLPGISNEYMKQYDFVYDEVKKLNQEMSKVKISMDDINKRLSNIREDMGNLNEKTELLIDNAILSEQMMQYSNRYRNSYEEIAEASSRAKELFDNQYKYADSLRTIVNAIEKVEPGVYESLKNTYYKRKKNETV